ncbi:hypothetical protein ABZ341_18125 [Streptomyces sp. NPDC006173]|uniref:hypothetical protein n=1 Tax=Streptomyces sp. NPDC006173 TaxID=3155349 RepID=UPI0033C2D6A2
MTDHLTDHQLDDQAVQILSNEGAQCGACGDEPGDRACLDCEKCRAGYVAALRAAGWGPRDEALIEAAVQARAALAALCYDLEDPGSDAYGALYLLSQATVGINAPKDGTADALFQHACRVLHGVADIADPEPPEVSPFGPTFGPQVADWLRMLAAPSSPVALAEGAQR